MAAILAATAAFSVLSPATEQTSPARQSSEESAPATVPVVEPTVNEVNESPSPAGAGARAYRDPVTGEFTSGPTTPTGRVTQPVFAPQNRSHAGLYEEVTPNGVIVDFQGRFFTASIATRDEDGNITIRPGAPQNPTPSKPGRGGGAADTTELDS